MTALAERERADTIPSAEDLIALARDMIPALRERARSGAQRRDVAAETLAEMQERGLFRVLQARRWGGYEMSPSVFCDVCTTLAEGDMSVGWIYGVIGVHAWQLSVMDDRAARDVWGRDDATLISSSYMPTGKAVREGDGYRLSGRWGYSSGSSHCDWVFLGGLAWDETIGEGTPRQLTFLLPRADYEIVDTWDTGGLRATGSNDVVVNQAFVPAYRTHDRLDGFNLTNPANALNDAALFHMPYGQIFVRAVSTASIGALQGFVDQVNELAHVRVNVWGAKASEDPVLALALAEAQNTVDELRTILHRNFATLAEYAGRREAPPIELRAQYRYQSSLVPERALTAAQRLFKTIGGGGVYSERPFAQILSDMTIGRQHAANNCEIFGRNWGALMLGQENKDFFL